MSVVKIETKEQFDSEVIGCSGLAVVDFFAEWCGPCKVIAPKIEAMANEYTDVKFFKVNVDESEDVAQQCEISAMPTFKLFKGGSKVDELVGANANKLKELIEKNK